MRILFTLVSLTVFPGTVVGDDPVSQGPAPTYYGTQNRRPADPGFAPLVQSGPSRLLPADRAGNRFVPFPRTSIQAGDPSIGTPARDPRAGSGNPTDSRSGQQADQQRQLDEQRRLEQLRLQQEAQRREYIRRYGDRRSRRFWRQLHGYRRSVFNQNQSGFSNYGLNHFGQNQRGFTYHGQSRFNQNNYGQSFFGQNRFNQTWPNNGFHMLIVPNVGGWQ